MCMARVAPVSESDDSSTNLDIMSNRVKDNWIDVQRRTFTNWINSKLVKRNHSLIVDVTADFKTGVKLLQLLEVLSSFNFPKYNPTPAMRIQRIENVNMGLSFMQSRGMSLTNIGAEDIVDGNQKLILGLVWLTILKYSIDGISQDEYESKDALLLWCKKRINDRYKNKIVVKDFTQSWKDGLGFCALVHSQRPDLIDYDSLKKENARENVTLAFDLASTELNIPKLLEPGDIVDVDRPDERSIITYVSQFFHNFKNSEANKDAGQAIGKYANDMIICFKFKIKYIEGFDDLRAKITSKIDEWNKTQKKLFSCDERIRYAEAKAALINLREFLIGERNEWDNDREKISEILDAIKAKREVYNIGPYSPPEGYNLEDISQLISELNNAETEYYSKLSSIILNYRKFLREWFSKLVNEIRDGVEAIKTERSKSYSTISDRTSTICGCINNLNEIKCKLEELKILEDTCYRSNVYDDVELAPDTSERLGKVVDALSSIIDKEKAAVDRCSNHLMDEVSLSALRLNTLSKIFNDADEDKDGLLDKKELRTAYNKDGIIPDNCDDDDFDKIYDDVFKNKKANFTEFVKSTKVNGLRPSVDDVVTLFRSVANDDSSISVKDLHSSGVSKEATFYLVCHMKQAEDGEYDYNTFIIPSDEN